MEWSMIYGLCLLGEPGKDRSATVLEKRSYGSPTLKEAIQTAKLNVANFPVPGTHGFFLLDEEGIEVFRWFSGDDHV
jgi:hypothetical protein